ncbi:hypothetical protein BDK92_3849 [Micromonospora pisi]|uniref:NACHT N-terminal Helical domain-containing protein n=1 Tax=Micromonospora pisi TaxID=589240 RepID=A0A495JKL7_9ACTN|nr:hypothetical protein [Micromonospora pisi]RKR89497.1 hypothetical protein BDK92_3849 [Micromonospora pisi]
MPKTLSYADAVRLLGGEKSRVVDLLDTLTGAAMLTASVPVPGVLGVLGWFDAKAELVRVSHQLVRATKERIGGLSRYGRTERLEAAHAVIVVVAFFEALADAKPPIPVDELELTKEEQLTVAGVRLRPRQLTQLFFASTAPVPGPGQPYAHFEQQLNDYYQRLAFGLLDFVGGLAAWERLSAGDQDAFANLLHTLPAAAVDRHRELYGQLAVDFPEVAFWAAMREHEGTRAEVGEIGIALAGLERLLRDVSVGRPPDERRAALARAYAAALNRPVVESGDVPEGLRVPTLGDAYVPPLCRTAELGAGARPSDEAWWDRQPIRDDLPEFLAGYLTSSGATRAPLLVLGQPGSGKSVLTRVLAGRLPAADFLPVRVILREVPAAADLQDQIEHAIRSSTGERLDWPALARSAGDALPVVLLDGFDELLQATGVSQTDYLIKVAAFQRREADQGRPVVVVVTSRTSVADRAQPPEGTVALRLEPFDADRVTSWLEVWNETNAAQFAARGVAPLAPETVLAHRELAAQPLLLLMLALYDADGNALQTAGELRRDELYERLLRNFARREVTKLGAGLPTRELERAVEGELRRLSVVAFAMFNRRVQWVAEADLEADLAALPVVAGVRGPTVTDAGLRAPLRPAEIVLGRFFFVHRSQASHGDDTRLETYEFLHATFGEYLVARLVWLVLRDIAAREAAATMSLHGDEVDDDLLHALLSFAVLSSRAPIVGFLDALGREVPEGERAALADLLIRLFRVVHQALPGRRFEAYRPKPLPVPARHAAYSANLLLLVVCVAGTVRGSQLYVDESVDVIDQWHAQALLWRSQLTGDEWTSMVDLLWLDRRWNGTRRDVVLTRDQAGVVVPPVDLAWTYGSPPQERLARELSEEALTAFNFPEQYPERLRRKAHFECGINGDVAQHALEPVAREIGSSVNSGLGRVDGWQSGANALIDAWLLPTSRATVAERERAYLRCAVVVRPWFVADAWEIHRSLLLERLATDTGISSSTVAEIFDKFFLGRRRAPGANDQLQERMSLSILRCGLAFLGGDSAADTRISGYLVEVLPSVKAWGVVQADVVARLHELDLHHFPLTHDEYDLLCARLRRRRPDLVSRLRPLIHRKGGSVAQEEVTIEPDDA